MASLNEAVLANLRAGSRGGGDMGVSALANAIAQSAKQSQYPTSSPLDYGKQLLASKIGYINASDAQQGAKNAASGQAIGAHHDENALEKLFHILGKPKTAVVAAIAHAVDPSRNYLKDLRHNVGTADVLAGADWFKGLPTWGKIGVGLAGDIAADPLTYLAPQAHLGTAAELATEAAGAATKARHAATAAFEVGDNAAHLSHLANSERLTELAGNLVTKGKGGIGRLGKSDLEFLSQHLGRDLKGGLYWNVPGTGRIGQTLKLADKATQIPLGRPDILRSASTGLFDVSAAIKGSKTFGSLSKSWGGGLGAIKNARLNSFQPGDAVAATHVMNSHSLAENVARGIIADERLFVAKVINEADKIGVDAVTLQHALGGQRDAVAMLEQNHPEFWSSVLSRHETMLDRVTEQANIALRKAGVTEDIRPLVNDLRRNHQGTAYSEDYLAALDKGPKRNATPGDVPFQKHANVVAGNDWGFMVDNPATGKPAMNTITLQHPTQDMVRAVYRDNSGALHTLASATRDEIMAVPENAARIASGESFDQVAAEYVRGEAGPVLGNNRNIDGEQLNTFVNGKPKQLPTDRVETELVKAHPEGLSPREQANLHAGEYGLAEPFNPHYVRSELNYLNQLEQALKNNIQEAYLVHHGAAAWNTVPAVMGSTNAKIAKLLTEAEAAGDISAASAAAHQQALQRVEKAVDDVTELIRKAGGGEQSPAAQALQGRVDQLIEQHQQLVQALGDELSAGSNGMGARFWRSMQQTPLDEGGAGVFEAPIAGAVQEPVQAAAPTDPTASAVDGSGAPVQELAQPANPTEAGMDQFGGVPSGTPPPQTVQEAGDRINLLEQHMGAAEEHVAQRLPEVQDELGRAQEIEKYTQQTKMAPEDVRQLRADVKVEAQATLKQLKLELNSEITDGSRLARPPLRTKETNPYAFGEKTKYVRRNADGIQADGHWDWFDNLSKSEQSRYYSLMAPRGEGGVPIDEMTRAYNARFGTDLSQDEWVELWRQKVDQIRVAKNVANGQKLAEVAQSGERLDWIAPNALNGRGIDIRTLLNGKVTPELVDKVAAEEAWRIESQIRQRGDRPIAEVQQELDQLQALQPNLQKQYDQALRHETDLANGITPTTYVDGFDGMAAEDAGLNRGLLRETNTFLENSAANGAGVVRPEDLTTFNQLGAAGDAVGFQQHLENLKFFANNDVADETRRVVEAAFPHVSNDPIAAAAVRANADDPQLVQQIVVANGGKTAAIDQIGVAAAPAAPSAAQFSSWADERTQNLETLMFDMVAKRGGVDRLKPLERSYYDQLEQTKELLGELRQKVDTLNEEYWLLKDKENVAAGTSLLTDEERAAMMENRHAHQALTVAADAAVRDAYAAQNALDDAAYYQWFMSPKGQQAFNDQMIQGFVTVSRNAQSDVGTAEMLELITRAMSKETQSKFLKVFDGLTRVFKSWSISNPGFIVRHGYTGMFMNYLNDVAPGMYRAFLKSDFAFSRAIAEGKSVEEALLAVPAKYRDSYELVHRSGALTGHSQISEAFGSATKELQGSRDIFDRAANNPITRQWNKQNFAVSRIARGAAAMHAAETKGSMEAIWDLVTKAHFDYGDINNFERVWGTRAMPFYIFFRKAIPAMVEGVFRNPKAFARFAEFQSTIQSVSSPDDLVPEWMRDRFNIKLPFEVGKGSTYLMPDLPIRTLTELTDPREALGNINPLLKTPIEMQLNSKLYFGDSSPFLGLVQMPEVFKITGLGKALELAGLAQRTKDGQVLINDKALYAIEQFFPYFGKARRLLPTEQRYQDRLATSIVDFLFGAGLRTVTEADQLGELSNRTKRVDQIAAQQNRLGYGGYDVMQKTVPLAYKPAKDAKKPYMILVPPKGGLPADNPYTSIKTKKSVAAVLAEQQASSNLRVLAQKVAAGR